LLSPSPAAHVRRPRIDHKAHATCLDRNEVGPLLVAAGLASPSDHALISLFAINGLRVSEVLGIEGGHRTLTVVRKGGKTGRHAVAGPSHWLPERLAEYVDAGRNGFVVDLGHDVPGLEDRVHRFAEEVWPKGRALELTITRRRADAA
jgi:hypothetical protein